MSDQNPTPAAAPLINAQTMRERFRDYGLNTVNQVVTMMMSGVYATAALALADILRTPDARALRLTMWLYSSLGAILMMMRQMHINALVVHPSPVQLPYQLIQGFLLASSFACLAEATGGPDGWRYAAALWVGIGLLATFGVTRIPSWLRLERYVFSLRPVIEQRLDDARRAARRLPLGLGMTVLIAAFALAIPNGPGACYRTLVGLTLLHCSLAAIAIRTELGTFQRFVDGVEQATVAATEG